MLQRMIAYDGNDLVFATYDDIKLEGNNIIFFLPPLGYKEDIVDNSGLVFDHKLDKPHWGC